MATVNVRFKDAGLVRLRGVLLELQVLDLTIGFQGESGAQLYPETLVSVAQVALFQEYGTEDIPARSFLRKAVFSNRKAISAVARREVQAAIKGSKSPVEALSEIGQFAADKIVARIRSGNFKALAPSTVAKKGHARPLIDSKLMMNSVSWAVRRFGEIEVQGHGK